MEEDLEQRLGEITQDEPSTPAAQQDEVEKLRRENARLQKKLGKYEPKPKPKPIVTPKPKPTSSNQPNHTIRNLVYTAIGGLKIDIITDFNDSRVFLILI